MKKLLLSVVFVLSVGFQAYAGNGDLIVDGSVGIGVASSPGTKLQVKGPDNSLIGHFSGSGDYALIYAGANAPDYQASDDGAVLNLGTRGGSPRFLSISTRGGANFATTDGNVGIGTPTPGYKLTVEGDSWTKYGNWIGSDAKLKKNVLPLSDALNKVLKLEGKSYEWKEDYYKVKETPDGPEVIKSKSPGGIHFGVIAQEIEKVLPEVVKENADGTKAVAYTEIIPVLIEAIKEQQKRIELLEKRLEGVGK